MSPSRIGLSSAASQRRLSSSVLTASGLQVDADPKIAQGAAQPPDPDPGPVHRLGLRSVAHRDLTEQDRPALLLHVRGDGALGSRRWGLRPVLGEQPVELALQRRRAGVGLAEHLGDPGQQVLAAGRAEGRPPPPATGPAWPPRRCRRRRPGRRPPRPASRRARPAAGWRSGSW